MTSIAKPIADSAAAILKIKMENTNPVASSKYSEIYIKFKLTESNNSSIDINIIIIFFLFKYNPQSPIRNKVNENNK